MSTTIDTWIAAISAVGEWGIVFVIYYEWEGQRLDKFLEDAEVKNAYRKQIFAAYCGIESFGPVPRNERFREMLDDGAHGELREACDDNIRLFSRIGARLPLLPWSRRRALDWHVVVLIWEILGPYVRKRREEAGPSFAEPFLRYALASLKRLSKQKRDLWVIVDPDRSRKNDVILTRDRLSELQVELRQSLAIR